MALPRHRSLMIWFTLSSIYAMTSILGFPSISRSQDWHEKKGRHFIVFYLEDPAFAAETIGRAEKYYSQINVELGLNHVVKRDRVTWLGNRRCQIYLYRNKGEFVEATRSPDWSAGKTSYSERIIWSFTGSKRFLASILPHEMAHILFREFVGLNNSRVPLWLDEGVAQYAEAGKRAEALGVMKRALQQNISIPFEELNRVRIGGEDEAVANLFYLQSASMVHFFIRKFGSGRFVDLCSALRDGRPMERALSSSTSSNLDSLGKFEEAWREFILRTR